MREQPRFSGFGPAGPVKRQVQPVVRRASIKQMPARNYRSPSASASAVPPQRPTAQSQYAKVLFPEQQIRRWQVAPEQKSQPKRRPKLPDFSWFRKQSKQQMAMLSAAVFIFVLGLGVALVGFKTNSQVEAQAKKLSQQHAGTEDEGDHPREDDPGSGAVADYQVSPDKPRRISIQKLGINARIKQLGTKPNNELKAPANIYDVGWYEGSNKLGERGATLLDGHVHGLTKPGVFYKLKNISIGDRIEVERGDGKIFRYEVVKKQTYNRENMDMKAAMSPIDPAIPGLNVITCTGQVDKANNTYTDRLLVQAVLVD